MRHSIVVATSNRGKLEELRALLSDLPGLSIDVMAISDVLPQPLSIVEDGRTFADNAVKKARAVASATMMLSLGDDSGLEVDVLDGRPGVHSARFAHDRATDAENNAALLHELEDLSGRTLSVSNRYKARFRCALALSDPFTREGEPQIVEGTCEGMITSVPRGSGGFGYDPLFIVGGMDKTMAELTEEEKNHVSHRARAFAALRPLLSELLLAREKQIRDVCG